MVTLDTEQYLALVSLAREGSDTPEKRRVLDRFLRSIEAQSGVTRYLLWVQWQELRSPLPPTADFPAKWPPELRAIIERTDRPIAKSDVLALVKGRANEPTNILVTKDSGAIVGWTPIDDFFLT